MDKARLRLFASFRTPAFQIATLPARNRGEHKLYVIPFYLFIYFPFESSQQNKIFYTHALPHHRKQLHSVIPTLDENF